MGRTRLAGVMAATILFTVGAAACGASDESGAPLTDSASEDAAGARALATTVAQPAASGGKGGAAPAIAGAFDRKIVFSASLRLEAADVARSFADVGRIAATAGGFVEQSSFSGANEERSASLVIRVPADRYQDTLAGLRGMTGVTVSEESSRSEEVTEQYTDLESRLRNLERTEQQYLELLAKAVTVPDILSLTDRLDGVRLQIEQVKGRLQVLDHMTELATVSVTLTPIPPASVAEGDGPPSVVEAFADAWHGSVQAARYVAAGGAYLAVVIAWLAIPAAAVALVASRVFRGRQARGA